MLHPICFDLLLLLLHRGFKWQKSAKNYKRKFVKLSGSDLGLQQFEKFLKCRACNLSERKIMQICWNRFWKNSWNHIRWNLFLAGFSHLKPLCSNLQLPKKHLLLLLLLQPRETPLWKTEKMYLIIWKIRPNKSLEKHSI